MMKIISAKEHKGHKDTTNARFGRRILLRASRYDGQERGVPTIENDTLPVSAQLPVREMMLRDVVFTDLGLVSSPTDSLSLTSYRRVATPFDK
jgi:hypothetical protein